MPALPAATGAATSQAAASSPARQRRFELNSIVDTGGLPRDALKAAVCAQLDQLEPCGRVADLWNVRGAFAVGIRQSAGRSTTASAMKLFGGLLDSDFSECVEGRFKGVTLAPGAPQSAGDARVILEVFEERGTRDRGPADLDPWPALAGEGKDQLPGVWLVTRTRLELLRARARGVETAARLDLAPWISTHAREQPQVLVTRRGQVLVRTARHVLAVTPDLRLVEVWSAPCGSRTGAIAEHGGRFLLAAEGSLIVLDAGFREIGRVGLGMGHREKEAHHILAHGDEALLLDNVVLPLILFRVDVSEPTRPRIVQKILEAESWLHLEHQWVDERSQRWAVISSAGGRGGDTQRVLLLPARKPPTPAREPATQPGSRGDPFGILGGGVGPGRAPPAEPGESPVVAAPTLYEWRSNPQLSRNDYTHKPTVRGQRFLAGDSQAPFWAVVDWHEAPTLVTLQAGARTISTRRALVLPGARQPSERDVLLARRGDWLVAAIGGKLTWIRTRPGDRAISTRTVDLKDRPLALAVAPN